MMSSNLQSNLKDNKGAAIDKYEQLGISNQPWENQKNVKSTTLDDEILKKFEIIHSGNDIITDEIDHSIKKLNKMNETAVKTKELLQNSNKNLNHVV